MSCLIGRKLGPRKKAHMLLLVYPGQIYITNKNFMPSKEKKERERRENMGKGTDLWDDSALINAFDHAMATYKVCPPFAFLFSPTLFLFV